MLLNPRIGERDVNEKQLSAWRERLIALRDGWRHELRERADAIAQQVRSLESSGIPTHPADHDSEGVEKEVEIARSERAVYDQVQAALERINAGRFGTCEECGKEISQERLDAVPYASRCASCATSRGP
ncbi:MAG: hypothetical protein DWQ34_24120 [Planctomycetota bacterium]|nr:MAG: hypothetical protein DWQ34_24120 [Planctomycetota bacterium]REK27818.1 MAG: hypothetical protein DWQ41_06870 [Planctomycetota bacterium]REK40272.1 MAG: hypothetical protein DWQ45_00110 [Planctomycetota bacterium]